MDRQQNLLEILEYLDPAELDYTEWCTVGMALQQEGYDASAWDEWSSRDPARYHRGECLRKWDTFHGAESPVTGGTLVQMAKDRGWAPKPGRELEWDGVIKNDGLIVDQHYIEDAEFHEPLHWNPAGELSRYLETLFESTENVGYVTQSWEKDGRYLPNRGNWDRTAGQLIEALSKCNGDIGSVVGDYAPEAGAWIRFNPLDGKGCKNENVTDFRYALVESDSMDLGKQNAIIRELELPVACLVYSGNKSLHAIVRVDAADQAEYRRRVNYLYEVCQKNGLKTDNQNRNPSRLSRMPGVTRKGKKQFILETNIGKPSWNEWQEWIDGVNDDLPEPESMSVAWDNLPELAEPLIAGVLRKGHKMLLAGPSKAGKSFGLIELSIAIAEGREWMAWPCTKGRVMYVNLELDRASGSGVFARDPDALLDLIELELTEDILKQEENKAVCAACVQYLNGRLEWQDDLSQDDLCSSHQMLNYCENRLDKGQWRALQGILNSVRQQVGAITAWRIEGTLREFPKFPPVNLWFRYPVHQVDGVGVLSDINPEDTYPTRDFAAQKRKKQAEESREKKQNEFEIEFSNLELEGRPVAAQELAGKLKTTSKELLAWLGDGKRQKKNIKDNFEKHMGEDGKAYIRRKE